MKKKDFSKPSFKPRPFSLNRIKIRRVRWQKQNLAIIPFCQVRKNTFSVKSRVVEHDNTSRFRLFKQTKLKPKFKQNAVSRTIILKRRHPFSPTNSGNNIGAFVLFAADFCHNFLPARRSRMFTIKTLINSAFVNVYNAFRGFVF